MPDPMEENVVALPTAARLAEPPAPQSGPFASAGPLLVPFPRWQTACERVSAALLGGETRVVVTGPPGTGKTLLLDHTARVLRAAGWAVVMRLAGAAPHPVRAAVLVDEADRLSREELHGLLAATPGPLVLAGLDALQSQIPGAIQVTLGALAPEEAREFIASWLVLAGLTPDNLAADAMRRTIKLSGGVPRLLSTLLGAASWLAENSDQTVITMPHIDEAAALRSCLAPEPVELAPAAEPATRVPVAALAATAMFLLGVAAFVATHFYPLELQRAFSAFRRTAERSLPDRRNTTAAAESKPPPLALAPVPVQPMPAPAPHPAAAPDVPPPPVQPTPAPVPHPAAAPDVPPPPAPVAVTPQAQPPAAPPVPSGPSAPEFDAAAPRRAEPTRPQTVAPPPSEPPPPAKTLATPSVTASPVPLEPPRSGLPAAMISLLLQRGQDMMGIGDVVAARLLFDRAATAGSAEAMLDMGKTYDPDVLAQASPLLEPEPDRARRWYHQAAKAGSQEAAERLRELAPDSAPSAPGAK